MLLIKNLTKNIIFLLILNIIYCKELSPELLGGWGEKPLSANTEYYPKIIQETEKYLVSQGYSLEENDIIPIGLFKQILNGVNYRIICGVKKKSDDESTIFDILMRKSNNEIKMVSSKNPDHSTKDLTEKDKKGMKDAIIKHYFEKLYEIKEFEIEYEYHDLDGLHKYSVYDASVSLSNKNINVKKRVLIIHRNDRTFSVVEVPYIES